MSGAVMVQFAVGGGRRGAPPPQPIGLGGQGAREEGLQGQEEVKGGGSSIDVAVPISNMCLLKTVVVDNKTSSHSSINGHSDR